MIKNYILLLLISLLIFNNLSIFSKPTEPQIKGGFKKCTSIEYRYKSGKIDLKSKTVRFVQIFDDNGNIIELISYENNVESFKNKIANKYNSDGLISEKVYFDETNIPFVKYTYNYDDKKNLIIYHQYDKYDKIVQKGSYKYDVNNFLIREIHEFYTNNESIQSITYFKNDEYGNPVTESTNRSLDMSVEVSSEVNLNTNKIDNNVNQNQSNVSIDDVTFNYKYNSKGQIIEKIRNGNGGTKLIYSFEYDKYGNISEQIDYYEDGKPAVNTVYEYSK